MLYVKCNLLSPDKSLANDLQGVFLRPNLAVLATIIVNNFGKVFFRALLPNSDCDVRNGFYVGGSYKMSVYLMTSGPSWAGEIPSSASTSWNTKTAIVLVVLEEVLAEI